MSRSRPTPGIRIRTLLTTDLPFADQLRTLAGWNQTLVDWQRFLDLEPGGCYLAEFDGTPAGTATTTVYGPDLAWIGMVLVHPQLRRRGVGQALLLHCLAQLRQRGVRTIKLDATPAGAEVYLKLGFVPEQSLTRWERPAEVPSPARPTQPTPAPIAADASVRLPADEDWPMCIALDTVAFGHPRPRWLHALRRQSSECSVIGPRNNPNAFGLLRPGSRAAYLGPVSASTADAATTLLDRLLTHAGGVMAFCDILDANAAAGEWARTRGFQPQRSLTRMRLGAETASGDPRRMFAIAGPEMG